MMSRFDMLYRQDAPSRVQLCEHADCNELAEHKAPSTKQLPESFKLSPRDDYDMERGLRPQMLTFCLAHVREYNRIWDFFEGMSSAEIDEFREDAMMGHRKARKDITSNTHEKLYQQAMNMRFGVDEEVRKAPAVPESERDALITLGLSYPLSKKSLKAKYRELVKKYHPDRAGKASEERFKQISQAYDLLKGHVQEA
jgi:DnaJ-domain-containing protein 1